MGLIKTLLHQRDTIKEYDRFLEHILLLLDGDEERRALDFTHIFLAPFIVKRIKLMQTTNKAMKEIIEEYQNILGRSGSNSEKNGRVEGD